MKLFFDTEFTGLHQRTTLISIGIISENDKAFYAEFTDYDKTQVDDWLRENVLSKCSMSEGTKKSTRRGCCYVCGTTEEIKEALLTWLSSITRKNNVIFEMWSDCLAYDWVLFNNLFGNALNIPKNISYIPLDVCTLFKIKGIDPDISREEFVKESIYEGSLCKHNALWDAIVIKECYNKLIKM